MESPNCHEEVPNLFYFLLKSTPDITRAIYHLFMLLVEEASLAGICGPVAGFLFPESLPVKMLDM